jgi:hyperosmotically inducible protein
MKRTIQHIALAAALAAGAVFASPMFADSGNPPDSNLANQVRHQLVMNPYYSVFDDLNYSIENGVVTLSGDVTWPVVKNDAVKAVKRLPGVTQVVDNIRVLPLSTFDRQIRAAEYRAVYGFAGMYRYAMGTQPSIHIIVDNGHVTLKGVVNNQGDKQIAYIRANSVPGVFSVTNDLQVAEKN